MDKIKINNQIVLMRKFVRQGKIHLISRYVKEYRLLENRKGEENTVLKCKRKADRLLLAIDITRKIKPDSLSKMALSKAKDWKAVMKQKNIPLEDRCFANLANFKPIQREVEKFYSANGYLVSRIPTILQELEEKPKLNRQSPQKNKKPFKNDKEYEQPGKESDIFKTKAKPEVENAQPKNIQPIIKKPLENEKHELSDESSNVSVSSSSSSDDDDNDNEYLSDEDNLNVTNSQKKLVKGDDTESNLNPHEADSSSSELDEDESVSQESDNEELEDQIPPKKLETVQDTLTIQKSKVNSVKNNPKLPKIPLETNKITDKLPTFKKNLSPKGNSTKAVALLNLNEMLDMDEIPIDNNRTVVETVEETSKRKRDTFFLSGDGDDFSESGDGEDSDNGRQGTSPSRKNPRTAFNRKGFFNEGGMRRENGFKNRRDFDNSPHSQKFGFREKKFHKNSEEFNLSKQSNKFERNQGRPESNFNKGKFNNFERNQGRPENYFNTGKFNKFERNQGRPENNFNKGKFNSFERNKGRPENNFNKGKFNKFERNQVRPENNFERNQGRPDNNFERNQGRPENNFNKNKKWNAKDVNEGTEGKPFKTSGKFFEKNMSFKGNDNSSHKQEGFNHPGKKDEPPLHPSWEAKKKLKATTKAKFQGKRVVFDD